MTDQYKFAEDEPNKIVFHSGNALVEEPILSISKDGFWVRGVKVQQDDKEAEAVYNAFQQWMTYCALRRSY